MESITQTALRQLINAARLLIRLVRMIIGAISQIVQAATAKSDRPDASGIHPPEPKE